MPPASIASPVPPPELELVRAFVNTVDDGEGVDQLGSLSALERWLRGVGVIAPGVKASGRDLRQALRLREALRADIAANHDRKPDPKATATLEDV